MAKDRTGSEWRGRVLQVRGWRGGSNTGQARLGDPWESIHGVAPTQILCYCLKAVIIISIPIQPCPPGRNSKFWHLRNPTRLSQGAL